MMLMPSVRVVALAFVFAFMLPRASAQDTKPPAPKKTARVPAADIYRPTPLPDRIVLTFRGDPATSMAVTWRTDCSVLAPLAQIARATDNSGFEATVETGRAQSEDLATDLGKARYHSVIFESLAPATKYAYRVGDMANWSEWFMFTTASREPRPFTFLYFGDAQVDIKNHWSRVVREALAEAPRARFLLHAGDLVNMGQSDAEWGEWFGAGAWVNATIANVPTPGNHEYLGRPGSVLAAASNLISGSAPGNKETGKQWTSLKLTPHWRAQFTLPEDGPPGLEETVYSFDYQGVRVISLNSNEKIEEQVPWLENRLRDNPNTWTIITFHHPIYSTAVGRDNKRVREAWQPVFDRFRVDLVLQGHDHSYGRSGLSLATSGRGNDSRDPNAGTLYVVSVSGPKMYGLEPQPWMRRSGQEKQLYQAIRVSGDRLHYEAHTATGEVYDVFELRKRPGQRNQLLEIEEIEDQSAVDGGSSRQGFVGVAVIAGAAVALLGLTALRRLLRPRSA
jgi:3',5'-cyclic AMP phosphodiesterase CpdA